MQTLLLDNRMTSRMNALSASLQLVRAEAVKRNGTALLLPGQGCRGGGAASSSTANNNVADGGCAGDWADGWTGYVERDGAEGLGVSTGTPGEGCHQVDRTSPDSYAAGASTGTATVDCLLWQEPALPEITLKAHAGTDGAAATTVTGIEFSSAGAPTCLFDTGKAPACYSVFVFCDSRGASAARALLLSTSGHVTPTKNDPQENPLTCPAPVP